MTRYDTLDIFFGNIDPLKSLGVIECQRVSFGVKGVSNKCQSVSFGVKGVSNECRLVSTECQTSVVWCQRSVKRVSFGVKGVSNWF